MSRAWRATLVPILISQVCRLVSVSVGKIGFSTADRQALQPRNMPIFAIISEFIPDEQLGGPIGEVRIPPNPPNPPNIIVRATNCTELPGFRLHSLDRHRVTGVCPHSFSKLVFFMNYNGLAVQQCRLVKQPNLQVC